MPQVSHQPISATPTTPDALKAGHQPGGVHASACLTSAPLRHQNTCPAQPRRTLHLLLALAALLGLMPWFATALAQEPNPEQPQPSGVIKRDGWSFDRSNIKWYDPKKADEKKQKGLLNEMCGWAEYDVTIPQDGWYELVLRGGVSGWPRDLFFDGKILLAQVTAGKEDMVSKDQYKDANLFLTAGKHSLRFRRLGFPGVLASSWELRPSGDNPAGCIFAKINGFNIVRSGESIKLDVTAGAPVDTEYEIVTIDSLHGGQTPVATLGFPATQKPITKSITIPCAAEGVFTLAARVNKQPLRPSDFRAGQFVVIDTKTPATTADASKKRLIHDIDCVKQTDLGSPIALDQGFWEVTEPTRVVTAKAGAYRESGDNTDPNLPFPPGAPNYRKYNSGFSYAIDVPEAQVPYLLEVEYPDDDRRTVNVFVAEPENDMSCQLYTGYETGDWYELSHTMKTTQLVFWARGTTVRAAILSKNPGMRAAASRVKVWRLEDNLPASPVKHADGRLLRQWMEEPTRWLQHAVPAKELTPIEKDFVAIERYCQLCRYHGFNAVQPTEAIYQGTTFYTEELEGWFVLGYDAVRIVALMCEKYGLRYIPELHLSDQAWFRKQVVEKLVPNPDELYIRSRLGTGASEGGSWFSSTWDPLHPAIQDKYIRIIGELVDKVKDSPAFAGVSLRLMSWVWQGWNGLPSLNWGYGDWDMAQFQKDTGIQVPGAAGDPRRFEQRFDFLTSDKMREQWIAWRCARMTDYYTRIRDRIRKQNPDAVLYLPYSGDAKQGMDLTFGSYFGTPEGAVREIGIDLDALRKASGIAFYPSAGYGRRSLGDLVADAQTFDDLTDPRHKALGFGFERAFGLGNAYFEDQAQVHVSELGLPEVKGKKGDRGNNGCAEGTGRYSLEKFATVLADQDTGAFTQGGMGYNFGQTPEYYEWFAEFASLPKRPFTALAAARDPVAVWYLNTGDQSSVISDQLPVTGNQLSVKGAQATAATDHRSPVTDHFFFYAVNREPYTAAITLTLTGAASIRQLGTGEQFAVKDGSVTLEMKPFQLRAFSAAAGTAISGATTVVPPERLQAVRDRLAWCQELLKELQGPRRNDVSADELAAVKQQVDTAWDALGRGHVWRARTALSTSQMVAVYDKLGVFPDGLLHRKQSINVLRKKLASGITPAIPLLAGEELQSLSAEGCRVERADSATVDRDWLGASVLKALDGKLELDLTVPLPGRYRLAIGHVADTPGAIMVSLAGRGFPELAINRAANRPGRTVFPVVALPAGKARLSMRGQGVFGIYGVVLEPVYRPLPGPLWATIGPFPTEWKSGGPGSLVKTAMERIDPPMMKVDLAATCTGDKGATVAWQWSDEIRGGIPHMDEAAGVSFLFRAKVSERGVCFGATFIQSPDERDAEILIGCDWWANAWLNGQQLTSTRAEKQVADDGCTFNGWRPLTAKVHLQKGANTLLVKSHGGTVANWFTCQISDPGDLKITAKP